MEARPSEAHPEHTVCVFRKIVMYQIVTLCLSDFYLVEDMGSWDAENEGLSLCFAVQMAAAGHILILSMVSNAPTKLSITSDCLHSPLGF